jgi:hypothetical protein
MNKKVLLYTGLAVPVFMATSAPLGFIIGVMANAFTAGTVDATVGAGDASTGLIVGIAAGLIYVLYCTYATFQYCQREFGSGA